MSFEISLICDGCGTVLAAGTSKTGLRIAGHAMGVTLDGDRADCASCRALVEAESHAE